MSNHKVPPPFKKGDNFEVWKKTLKIWQAVTPLPKEKQGAAIFLSLDSEAQEAVLELDEGEIACDDGVKNVIGKLDQLYLRDRTQLAFEALEEFESTTRKDNQDIKDFCNKFELAYNKAKIYGTNLSSDVLAFRLLKSANLTKEQESLVKATVGELTFEKMKSHLKRINMTPEYETADTKQEPIFVTEEITYDEEQDYEEDIYFTHQKPRQNVPDEFGNPTRCSFCQSIFHYVKDCPHATASTARQRGGLSGYSGTSANRGVPHHRGAPSYRGASHARGASYSRGRPNTRHFHQL